MVLPSARSGLVRVASVAGAFVPCIVLFRIPFALPAAMTFLFLATAIHVLLQPDDIRNAASETALTVTGYLYVPLLLAHLVLLRLLPHGIDWVFLLLFIVMMSDTCAYYLGSRFGRHKLYPAVSPNKSVEGAAGGLVGALVGAFLCRVTFFAELNVMDCFYIALAGGSLAQVGDLFESLLKRSCGVKDSGTIIPGHGGMLDRLDSILFAAPLIYYYALIVFYGRVGF
jgi:phosphatidate cytidylyltransferase